MGNDIANISNKARTTVGLEITTKSKLDRNKAPGQSYNGFIWQLVDWWEKTNSNERASVTSTVKGNQGTGV